MPRDEAIFPADTIFAFAYPCQISAVLTYHLLNTFSMPDGALYVDVSVIFYILISSPLIFTLYVLARHLCALLISIDASTHKNIYLFELIFTCTRSIDLSIVILKNYFAYLPFIAKIDNDFLSLPHQLPHRPHLPPVTALKRHNSHNKNT